MAMPFRGEKLCFRWVWLVFWLALAATLLAGAIAWPERVAESNVAQKVASSATGFSAWEGPAGPPRTIAIQDVQLGERVSGVNPLRHEVELVEPDPATWREIRLHLRKTSGKSLWVDLLRPLSWIEAAGAKPGETIYLELPEMGAVGDAEVTYLRACPEIKAGAGTVVTGRFAHQVDEDVQVLHLQVEGQERPTGVTANHPYWSEDRQAFVAAGELRIGEQVNTHFGLRRVTSITPYSEYDGFVYNLETGEHVYRVAAQGILVHNNCDIILFGQPRIAEKFRKYGPNPNLADRTILEVVEDLRVGLLTADDIPLNVFQYRNRLYTENNRGLAALSLAGLKPTKITEIVPTQNMTERVDEMLENGIEGFIIPVTKNKDGTGHLYTVFLHLNPR